jgi:hypothetical protein
MERKRYATAAAFRRALEDRLQDIAGKEGVDLQRLRRQVAFDRLLARLFQAALPRALPWVLKGGYAMEQSFGWMKMVGMLRKVKLRGIEKVGWLFTFTGAAYNLSRLRNLMARA